MDSLNTYLSITATVPESIMDNHLGYATYECTDNLNTIYYLIY